MKLCNREKWEKEALFVIDSSTFVCSYKSVSSITTSYMIETTTFLRMKISPVKGEPIPYFDGIRFPMMKQ